MSFRVPTERGRPWRDPRRRTKIFYFNSVLKSRDISRASSENQVDNGHTRPSTKQAAADSCGSESTRTARCRLNPPQSWKCPRPICRSSHRSVIWSTSLRSCGRCNCQEPRAAVEHPAKNRGCAPRLKLSPPVLESDECSLTASRMSRIEYLTASPSL